LLARAAQLAVGLYEKEEDHARGTEMGETAVFVLPVGVHYGEGGGQGFEREMVVEDDHVSALCGGDGIVAEGAAVDADD
jgi:hypothetical protein